MTSISQTVPQWQINQIFEAAPAVVVNALRPLIIGPDYAVRRYSANKAAVLLGTYAAASLAVAWPGLQVGEVVDQSYTSVNVDAAASEYYLNLGSDVTMGSKLNQVTSSTLSFATNGTYARSAGIPTDALIGDQIILTSGSTKLVTTITGLIANVIAATIGSPAALAGNIGTNAGSSSETTGANTGTAVPTVSGLSNPANYHGEAVGSHGQMSETYTVTVTAAGSDCLGNAGAWTSARLSITSASGTDAAQTGVVPVSGTPFAVGSRGARFELSHGSSGDDLVVGDTWNVLVTQAYTIPTKASAGSYTGATSTTYVVTVTKGGKIDSGTGSALRAQVTVSTTTGIDVGGPYTVLSGTPIVIGSLGVTITLTGAELVIGDGFTILATAASGGAIQTIQLANNLPTALQSGALGIQLAIVQNVVVSQQQVGNAPTLNWTGSPTAITLNAVMQTAHSRTGALALPILSGQAYATYRALRTAGANEVQPIVVNADIVTAGFSGVDDVDSGMSYGLSRAISNAAGTTIQAISVQSDDLAGYNAALAQLNNREDFYRAVPLTQDATIIEAVESFVNGRSGPTVGRWATATISLGLTSVKQLGVAGLTTITTDGFGHYIDVTDTSGLAKYITNGVKAGDILRALYTTDGFGNVSYSSFVIASVTSEEALVLVAGPSLPVSVASTSQVWHPLSVAEQAADLGIRSQAVSGGNRRVTSVFPANPARGGVSVPGYYLACSLAALRGASVPQQGLTNAEVLDWDDMSQASKTFASQLDILASYGMYIVTQSPTGSVYIRKQLTCDTSAIANSEDSITVNVDSCSYILKGVLSPFVGKSNNVPSNRNAIQNAINGAIVQLQNQNFDPSLGGMMGPNAGLVYLRPNAIRADALSARVDGDFPIPINNGFLDLVIGTDLTTVSTTGTNANSQPG
jgi:hypothetical protein